MAMKIGNGLDLQQTQILNPVIQNLSSAPSAPVAGQEYFNTTSKVGFVYSGTAWRPKDAAALTDGTIAIAALATNPLARANHTGTQTASTISDLSTVVKAYTLDTFAAPVASVSFGNQKQTNVASGSAATDGVNYGQVNQLIAAAVAGQTAVKNPVRVIATSAITLSGTQTIDSVSVAAGDRVLVTAQSAGANNLIYVVASGAWTIATDNNTTGQLIEGTDVLVNEGSVYAGSIWRVTTVGTITIGTTSVTWVQTAKANTYTADGTTTTLTGMVFSVNYGSGLTVSGSKLVIDTSIVARKYAVTLTGDGSTTSFTVTHNLGTQDITVSIRDSSNALLLTDVTSTSTTQATIVFGTAPASGVTYRIVVTG